MADETRPGLMLTRSNAPAPAGRHDRPSDAAADRPLPTPRHQGRSPTPPARPTHAITADRRAHPLPIALTCLSQPTAGLSCTTDATPTCMAVTAPTRAAVAAPTHAADAPYPLDQRRPTRATDATSSCAAVATPPTRPTTAPVATYADHLRRTAQLACAWHIHVRQPMATFFI